MQQQYQRAFVLISQHRYADAEAELRMILAGAPSESRAHALLAIVMTQNEDRLDEAYNEAMAAVAHEPNEPLGHYAVSIVELNRKHYEAASDSIDEAIRLDPLDSRHWAMRARCDFNLARFKDMLQHAEKGLALNPEDIECRNLLSLALERTGNVSSSLEQAMETLRMDPDDDDSHAMLGFTLLQNGKHIEARDAFREALRINPMNEYARSGMMEAISSRSIVFRTVNRFYSWLNRMPAQQQMFIIFGGWVLMQLLSSVGKNNPTVQMLSLPILLAYLSFAVMTWIATPLFQTFLRFHPFGKHLLRDKETRLSNVIAPCLMLAVVGGAYGWFSVDLWTGSGVAFYWVMATMISVCCFHAASIQSPMKYATFALSAVIMVLPLYGLYLSLQVPSYAPIASKWQTAMWCFLGLQFMQNVIAVRNR